MRIWSRSVVSAVVSAAVPVTAAQGTGVRRGRPGRWWLSLAKLARPLTNPKGLARALAAILSRARCAAQCESSAEVDTSRFQCIEERLNATPSRLVESAE